MTKGPILGKLVPEKPSEKSKPVSIRITEEEYSFLHELAEEQNTTVAGIIRMGLTRYLEQEKLSTSDPGCQSLKAKSEHAKKRQWISKEMRRWVVACRKRHDEGNREFPVFNACVLDDFQNELKDSLAQMGLTGYQMAEILQVSDSTISRLVSKKGAISFPMYIAMKAVMEAWNT